MAEKSKKREGRRDEVSSRARSCPTGRLRGRADVHVDAGHFVKFAWCLQL